MEIEFIKPIMKDFTVEGNTVTVRINFKDGLGFRNIIIKRGNGFYTWIDKPYQIREFTSLDFMAYEFELPIELLSALKVMQSGDVSEKPFMNMGLMAAQLFKSFASNFTPPKKKRK
jgi:hypothetical protein